MTAKNFKAVKKAVLKFWKKKGFLPILFTVFLIGGCTPPKLQNVKSEAEANQIIDVLGESGIRATKSEIGEGEKKSFEVYVQGDEETVKSAIQLIEDHCLARPEPPSIEGGAIITSVEVEQARNQRRLKMNIESQLRSLPGVTCVTVNFVPPEDRSLAIRPYPSTAAVTVNYKTPTFPYSEEQIAALVAKSVPALQTENVSVLLGAKPLRPLPESKIGYNLTRIALVSGIGFATILGFVSMIFVLRKKRRNQVPEEQTVTEEDFDNPKPATALPRNDYDFDDDEDINLP